mmetsp:Transcript_173745/g.551627  ORF Transcript_173745/g.551627 Transcript_173745/m.551627 type:complete len:480 (+) Transcript_173745:54-1493(+)
MCALQCCRPSNTTASRALRIAASLVLPIFVLTYSTRSRPVLLALVSSRSHSQVAYSAGDSSSVALTWLSPPASQEAHTTSDISTLWPSSTTSPLHVGSDDAAPLRPYSTSTSRPPQTVPTSTLRPSTSTSISECDIQAASTAAPSQISNATGVVLLTSLFARKLGPFDRPDHYRELLAAVGTNLMNIHLAKVHVLFEGSAASCESLPQLILAVDPRVSPSLGKLRCFNVSAQPMYADFLGHANAHLRGWVTIVANTDIAFDDTLRHIDPLQFEANANLAFVLSVMDPQSTAEWQSAYRCAVGRNCTAVRRCTLGRGGGRSWDAFVFRAPLPQSLDLSRLGFLMNINGAENVAAYELARAGMQFWNPCLKVHAIHWHCSVKMHHRYSRLDKKRGNTKSIMPCWECQGLRDDGLRNAELCTSGSRRALIEKGPLRRFFLAPDRVALCCPGNGTCDEALVARKGEDAAMCKQPSDTSCTIWT